MIILFDVATREFSIEPSPEPNGDILVAAINRHGMTVPMQGVQFGFTATANGEQFDSKSWPPPGVSYAKTDQDTIASYRLTWQPDDEVSVNAWLVDSLGQRHEASAAFIAPRPPQPYPSWTWVDGDWTAPTPHPLDDMLYEWDEALVAWVHVDQDHLP